MVESKNELYDVIKSMCDKKGVSIAQMCRDVRIRDGLISDLKVGKASTLSMGNLYKIASYFCCSTDVFFSGDADAIEPKKKRTVDSVQVKVDVAGLDEAIEKAEKLKSILEQASLLVEKINSSG